MTSLVKFLGETFLLAQNYTQVSLAGFVKHKRKRREEKFKAVIPSTMYGQVAEFWANEIFSELEIIFQAEHVRLDRFHDSLARKITGKYIPGQRIMFECPLSHFQPSEQCCKNKEIFINMIEKMKNFKLRQPKKNYNCLKICMKYFTKAYNRSIVEPLNMSDQNVSVIISNFYSSGESDYFCAKPHFEKLEHILEHLVTETSRLDT